MKKGEIKLQLMSTYGEFNLPFVFDEKTTDFLKQRGSKLIKEENDNKRSKNNI